MAHIVRYKYSGNSSAVTSHTAELPPHESGDFLAVMAVCTPSGTTMTTATTGWTKQVEDAPSSGAYRQTCTVFTKVATSSSETDPVISLSASERIMTVCFVLDGVDTTDPIDVYNSVQNDTTLYKDMPTVTTSNDGSLLIYIASGNADYRKVVQLTPVTQIATMQVSFIPTFGWVGAGEAGTTAQHHCVQESYNGGTSSTSATFVVAFNSVDGEHTPTIDPASPPATLISTLQDDFGYGLSSTFDPSTSLITSLDGFTTGYDNLDARNLFVDQQGNFKSASFNGVSGSNVNLQGLTLSSSQDLSDAVVSFFCWIDFHPISLQPFSEGGRYIVFMDSNDNWATWKVEAQDTKVKSVNGQFSAVVHTSSTPTDSSGTIDWTDIDRICLGVKTGGAGYINFNMLYKHNAMALIGGSENHPCTFTIAGQSYGGGRLMTVSPHRGFTAGQYFSTQEIKVGNCSDATYFDATGQSIAFPGAYAPDEKDVQIYIESNRVGLTICGASGNTIKLRSCVVDGGNYHFFKFDASSVNADIYDFNGLLVLNGTITLPNLSNLNISGSTWSGCKEITNNGTNLDGAKFDSCVDTQCITITSESEWDLLEGSTWTNNNIAILITGDQSGTWQDNDLTVSGNTYDIQYTGNTNFSIQSSVTLSKNETGSGVVSIVTPSPTVTVTVTTESGTPIENANVFIRESGGGSTILSDLTNSSGVVTTSYTGSIPQNIEGWVRKATGSPLYKQFTLGGQITSSGYTATALMQGDE